MVFTYELKIVLKNEFYHIPGYHTYPLTCSTIEGTPTDYIVMEKNFGSPNPEQQSLVDIIKDNLITQPNPVCGISLTFR